MAFGISRDDRRDDPPVADPDPAPSLEDREWIERVRAGDEAAFEAMFRTHYNNLCVFASRLVGSDAVAEEVVQDVFLRLWQQHESLEISSTVAGYLYGSVRNRALGHLRHERVDQRWREDTATLESAPAVARPSGRADDEARANELAAAIDRAIERLPPRCREAYVLRRQHHLGYAEIARVMGISPRTVEVQIGTALKALRAALADWLEP